MISDAQRTEALRLFYDEGMTLGEVADRLNLPRGLYDLSPWIYSARVREEMRREGRWKPAPRELAWHLKMTAADL